MKLVRNICYDAEAGVFRFWKRYLLTVVSVIVMCIVLRTSMEYFLELYQTGFSPLEYAIHNFFGQYPFHYDADNGDSFKVPFVWLVEYGLLAYCIGNYVTEDMHGFGLLLMAKSECRWVWWLSKCIWCIMVNLIHFGIIWGVNIGFSWVMSGDIHFVSHEMLATACFGYDIAQTTEKSLLVMTMLMPFMVGVVQSLIQMILSVKIGEIPSFVAIIGGLVGSAYYSNRFLIHGYAMLIRYYENEMFPEDVPLKVEFGIIYLMIWMIGLMYVGDKIIQKKDIMG